MLTDVPLGKATVYPQTYDPKQLCPIPRSKARSMFGLTQTNPLPFYGLDIWNAYEVSWLNPNGKPQVAVLELHVPADSEFLVESKSLKLYLNSINYEKYPDVKTVKQLFEKDLTAVIGKPVQVILHTQPQPTAVANPSPTLLDDLDIETDCYTVNPGLLATKDKCAKETLGTHLFRSCCLVTSQPDWAYVEIHYEGPAINHEALLKYLISYRNHTGFAEQCCEHIFVDLMEQCKPKELTVYFRTTRRGGIDINPIRSTQSKPEIKNDLSWRQ